MRQLRSNKGEAIVTIPPVIRLVIVGIQPATIIIAVSTEQIRIAIGIIWNIINYTTFRYTPQVVSYSAYFIIEFQYNNAVIFHTKYLHF